VPGVGNKKISVAALAPYPMMLHKDIHIKSDFPLTAT
jgi:hypothetical protein